MTPLGSIIPACGTDAGVPAHASLASHITAANNRHEVPKNLLDYPFQSAEIARLTQNTMWFLLAVLVAQNVSTIVCCNSLTRCGAAVWREKISGAAFLRRHPGKSTFPYPVDDSNET